MIAKADDKELKEKVIGKRKSSARVSDATERELWSSRKVHISILLAGAADKHFFLSFPA